MFYIRCYVAFEKMAKIKQKYMAYKTAERNFNKRKVALSNEFTNEMNEAAKIKDLERFYVLGDEMVRILGKYHSGTITALEVLHGINAT